MARCRLAVEHCRALTAERLKDVGIGKHSSSVLLCSPSSRRAGTRARSPHAPLGATEGRSGYLPATDEVRRLGAGYCRAGMTIRRPPPPHIGQAAYPVAASCRIFGVVGARRVGDAYLGRGSVAPPLEGESPSLRGETALLKARARLPAAVPRVVDPPECAGRRVDRLPTMAAIRLMLSLARRSPVVGRSRLPPRGWRRPTWTRCATREPRRSSG